MILFISLALTGCASTGSKLAYDKQAAKYKLLDDVTDEKALETYTLIYNVQPRTWEIETARSLSLEEFSVALKKRKSRYIRESGVFDLEYKKVDLQKWSDAQIIEFYDHLNDRIKNTNIEAIPESTDDENALRIIYMSARDRLAREGHRREGLRNFWTIFGQVVNVALAVAVSAI